MTNLEKRIKTKLEKALVGEFLVSVDGDKVTISATEFSANSLWDEIEANSIFGDDASGWMSAYPANNYVVLSLSKMVI